MPRLIPLAMSLIALNASLTMAQDAVTSTAFSQTGDQYYEAIGTNWGVSGRGWFFNWGGGGAVPPFGGYTPNSGLTGGVGFNSGGLSGRLNFFASQGYSSTVSSVSPSVTSMSGVPAAVIDTNYRPFITEIVPVVAESSLANKMRAFGGKAPLLQASADAVKHPVNAAEPSRPATSHVARSTTSSATRGEASLADIRREQEREDAAVAEQVATLIAQADAAEAKHDFSGAASLLAKAAYRREGEERRALLDRSRSVRQRGK